MGSSPRTKADYRKKIADKQAKIAQLRATLPTLPPDGVNRTRACMRSKIAYLQGEIAHLRAKMVDAPNK